MMERLRVLTVRVEDPSSVPKHPTTSLSLPLLLVISSQTRIEIMTLCVFTIYLQESKAFILSMKYFSTFFF